MAQFSGRSFWRCNGCGLILDTFPVMGDEDISDFEASIIEGLQNNETERPKTKMNYKLLLNIMFLTISLVILILLQRVYF
jgi:hypothetical protein